MIERQEFETKVVLRQTEMTAGELKALVEEMEQAKIPDRANLSVRSFEGAQVDRQKPQVTYTFTWGRVRND